MKYTYNLRELAEAIGLAPATVKQYASRYPERLPPRLTTPTRRLLWSIKTVEEWLEAHDPKREAEPPDQTAASRSANSRLPLSV